MAIDKSKYVVLDIETNGLYVNDDVLSISIYKPDDGTSFNKFLPLELAKVLDQISSKINGIKEEDLVGATPLTQREFNELIQKFELNRRIILTYSEFDKRMLKHYFIRKGLYGFDKLNFYNFKRDVISSRFSEGNVTKDNLCAIYGIENVQKVHSSINDCILEWKLFEKMEGNKLLITNNKVFEMNDEYIIPISYFNSHPNLERYVTNFPNIKMETELVKRFELKGNGIEKFETNINGMLIEHLLNTMLQVDEQDSYPFLVENKSKLSFLGTLPSRIYEIPLVFKEDGTVKALNLSDKVREKEFNKSLLKIKAQMSPVIEFISKEIFKNEKIMSQELVIHKADNILALCDLSSENTVMEIKTTSNKDAFVYRNQLYYEAKGRKCFLLQIDWTQLPKVFAIEILECFFSSGERPKKLERKLNIETLKERINNENIDVIHYAGKNTKMTLKCKICEHEWKATYHVATNNPKCPFCEPIDKHKNKEAITDEERRKLRETNYIVKLLQKSNGCINAYDYIGTRYNVSAKCLKCEYTWEIRADHLLDRPYCPSCKANKN